MDEIITKLLTTVSTLTGAVERLEATVSKQSSISERIVAAQEQAIAKMDANGSGGTTTRRRSTAKATEAEAAPAEPAPAAAEPVHPLLAAPNNEMAPKKNPTTGVEEQAPTANFRAKDFSRDEVKSEFVGWLGDTTDAEVRKDRAAFVTALGQHFGKKQIFHPTDGLTDEEQRKQTLFYLRRKREGLKVDFGAEYDFDGDPLADQTVDAAPAEDEADQLG